MLAIDYSARRFGRYHQIRSEIQPEEKVVKAVVSTDEYTIFQKRNERFAVRNADRAWINGDAKVAILLEHGLIKRSEPKPAEPEPVAAEPVAEAADAGSSATPAPESDVGT